MIDSEMGKDERPASTSRDRVFTATCALIASAVACTVVVLAVPRLVEPVELPALRLERSEVAAQLASDRADAARAPRGDDVSRWQALYREDGLSELSPHPDHARIAKRRVELASECAALFHRVGDGGARALVAATTESALAGLRGELPAREAQGLLGIFPVLLRRYGFIDADGTVRAPELSLRAFYKARLNLICERPRAFGLSAIELQALEGWNALHAQGLSAGQRLLAAKAFHDAAGNDALEAVAIWLFANGARERSHALLERKHEKSGLLRMRNMALFAAHAD